MRYTYERDGQRFSVDGEGDTPPNEQELEALWQEHLQAQPGMVSRAIGAVKDTVNSYIDYKKTPDQKERELAARGLPDVQWRLDNPDAPSRPLAGTDQPFQPQPGDITGLPSAMARSVTDAWSALGPTAIRVGAPLAAAATLPTGVGTIPAIAYLAGTGLLSARAAKMLEGNPEPLTMGEGAMAAATSATMMPYAQGVGALPAAALRAVEGAGISASADIEAGRPIDTTNMLFGGAMGAAGGAVEGSMLTKAQAIAAAKRAQTYQKIAANSKAGAATATEQALAANKQRADDFLRAKQELAANDLETALKASPLASAEPVAIGPLGKEATLDVRLGQGVGAAKERAAFAPQPVAPVKSPAMSAQAQRMMEEYGRINPSAMFALARTGAGGVAGYLSGDTTEEKLGRAAIGATLGLASVPAAGLAKRVGYKVLTETKLGRRAGPEAILDPLMESIRRADGERDALVLPGKFALKEFNKAMGAIPEAQRESVRGVFSDYMNGVRNVSDLPPSVAPAAMRMRQAIDDLTIEGHKIGLFAGKMGDTAMDDLGRYLRQSYQKFLNPKWMPDTKVVDEWITSHVDEAIAAQGARKGPGPYLKEWGDIPEDNRVFFKQVDEPGRFDPGVTMPEGSPNGTKWVPKSREEITQYYRNAASKLLYKGDDAIRTQFMSSGVATIDNSLFKKRQKLEPLTQKMLGIVDDPIERFNDTLPRMARSIAAHKMEQSIAKIGSDLGIFKPGAQADVGNWVELSPGVRSQSPYNGLYSSPEIRDALASYGVETKNWMGKLYGTASSAVKLNKTLGSSAAYASNNWGGLMDVVAQGHIFNPQNARAIPEALKIAAINLGLREPGKMMDTYQFMVRERLLNRSVSFHDFASGFTSTGPKGAIKKAAGWALDKAGKAYMTAETMGKVINFNAELRTLKAARPGVDPNTLKQEAAALTRATTADFGQLPQSIHRASRYMVLDPFVAYQADRFRVVYNTYRVGLEQVASGNPVMARAGAKRIAAMTTLLGVGAYLGSNTHLSPEKAQALRNLTNSNDRQGLLTISDLEADDTFSYTNLNYNIPHTIAVEAAAAAMRGDTPQQASMNFVKSAGQQALGSSLLVSPIFDVIRGENAYGRNVYNGGDTWDVAANKSVKYLANEWIVPLAYKEAKKGTELEAEIAKNGGESYRARDLLLKNVGGVRIYRKHAPTSMRFEASALSRDSRDAQTEYASIRRRSLDPKDVETGYQELEQRRKNSFAKLEAIAKDGRALGYDDGKIVKILKDGGVSSKMIAGAMDGIYLPSNKNEIQSPSDMLAEWKASGKNIRDEIYNVQRNDRALASRLMNAYRDDNRMALRNVTESDQLLEAFSESDGSRAQYVATKYQNIVKAKGRDAAMSYMKELERKRLVGPETKRLLMKAVMAQAQADAGK